jgi:hypothetical protein
VPEGAHYNPYFIAGSALAMAQPIFDEQVAYDDGSPETVDQYAKDVAAFLMWAAEPHMEERKQTGFMVIIFLAIFASLLFLTKKSCLPARNTETAIVLNCESAACGRRFRVRNLLCASSRPGAISRRLSSCAH